MHNTHVGIHKIKSDSEPKRKLVLDAALVLPSSSAIVMQDINHHQRFKSPIDVELAPVWTPAARPQINI